MEQPLSFWELWQVENYGDILEKKAPEEEFENGFAEQQRIDARLDDYQYFSMTEQDF